MKHLRSRPLSTVAMLAMVAALAPPTAASGAEAPPPKTSDSPARELRSLHTSDFGLDRPSGVTYAPQADELLIAGDEGAGSTVLRVTPREDERRPMARPRLADGGNAAFDPRRNRLDIADPERLPEVEEARGSTYAPDGTQYVLDAASDAIVSVSPDGSTDEIPLKGLDGAELQGLAHNPQDGRIYVANEDASKLHALDESGSVAATHDLSGVEVQDLQAMTFGDSADNTDDPAAQSLYVADAGEDETLGRIAEVTLAEPVVTTAAVINGTVVNTHDLSALNPPSSDSAGVAYMPDGQRLLVSDSEINETTYYEDVNLFMLGRDATYVDGGTTVPYSDEPTGSAINPTNGWLYTTDDDDDAVYEVRGPGADGVYGTADDPVPNEVNTAPAGNGDAEGAAFDAQRGHLLVVDGVGKEVFRYNPGPNGQLGDNDDVVTQFDVGGYGAEDPEGIEYDEERDTIAVLDDGTGTIYEVDVNGALLNTVDVSAANGETLGGLAIAPASDDSGARNYYLVDRGNDPGVTSDPGAIDGALYEVSANLGAISNFPPTANAGPDRMAGVGETITLSGSANDPDGDPLTYSWTQVDGAGTANLGSANSATTTATFSTAGQYTLRLTASDSQVDGTDDVVVDVYAPGDLRTWSIPIETVTDDAHEGGGTGGKFVDTGSADIELGNNGAATPADTIVGLRFNHVPIPQGAEVVSAKVQFTSDEVGTDPASYTIAGHAVDNSPTFVHGGGGDISSRPLTTARVPWAPPAWEAIHLTGAAQLTSELQSVVQEIVNRSGWTKDNALALVIDGTGRRTAEARELTRPPVLQLQFRVGSEVVNTAPVVDAGQPQTVTLPDVANLDGTVTDDGLPTPPGATTQTWSKVSGEGDVTFGDASATDTTAKFAAVGTYVLRLTAKDGQHEVSADVTVTVNPPDEGEPGVGLDCGDVAQGVCVQMSDHKDGLAASGVRDLGQRIGPAERVGAGALMEFTRGTVYWSPGQGAHAVWGAILNKYERFGGPTSVLGFPETDEGKAARPGSRLSRFTGGRIYWSRGTGAHEVHGAILKKFVRLGAVRALGLPTSDERSAGVPGGRMSRFTGGRIYWSRSTGAHEVHGAILSRYLNGGGPRAWGLPVSDERRYGAARFSRFTKGRIYWSRSTGARLVYGAILGRYLRMGGHTSWLGLPVREEWSVRGGRQAAFVNGWIYWNASPYFTRVFRR